MRTGMKFVASYSGGKDSILAIYRAIKCGMIPVLLIITYRTDKRRSWFHGIPSEVLQSVSESMNIPIHLIETTGEKYSENFVKALKQAKNQGADACVFGDIDIEAHRVWCTERCEEAKVEPVFPLWGEDRKKLVYEFLENQFIANITIVDTQRMKETFLGKLLTKETAEEIEAQGADICGENGEYHTFVSAGPLFQKKVEFVFDNAIQKDNYAVLPIKEANIMKVYCYAKCSTCKKALKWLDENEIDYDLVDIKEKNPTKEQLAEYYHMSHQPLKKFFNTSGLKYKELRLKDRLAEMSEEEQLEILASDGMLVKRPLVVGKDFVLFGFKEEIWEQVIIPQ